MIANLLSMMVEVAATSNEDQCRNEMKRLHQMGAPIRKETEHGYWECPREIEPPPVVIDHVHNSQRYVAREWKRQRQLPNCRATGIGKTEDGITWGGGCL